jgi:hypothetical protein
MIMNSATIKANFLKYGGRKSVIWLSLAWLFGVAAFVFGMLSLQKEGQNLFVVSTDTEDILAHLSPFYYWVNPMIAFILFLAFTVLCVLGLLSGQENFLSIGILGFAFDTCFLAGRSTLISVAASVFPGTFAVGDYIMIVFAVAGIYCFITTILNNHFIENFRKTYAAIFYGMLGMMIFLFFGCIPLFEGGMPLLATSCLAQIGLYACFSVFAFRTFRSAAALID